MGDYYYCPLCHGYHDTSSCCPTNIQTVINTSIQEDPNFQLNWRLDKIITLLESLLTEVRNK
jgi:hypothetical protein